MRWRHKPENEYYLIWRSQTKYYLSRWNNGAYASLIVLKMRTCLWARVIRLLADSIVDAQIMRTELHVKLTFNICHQFCFLHLWLLNTVLINIMID